MADTTTPGRRERLSTMTTEEFQEKYVRPDMPTRCTWKLGEKENNKNTPHNHIPFVPEVPKIYPNILHKIGRTPLVRLNVVPREFGVKCEVLVKCEFFNAGGSGKSGCYLSCIIFFSPQGFSDSRKKVNT